jgi:hypothetical protein
LSRYLDLLELNDVLLHLLHRLLLLPMRRHSHPFLIRLSPLDFDLKIDGAVADLAVGGGGCRLLLLDV